MSAPPNVGRAQVPNRIFAVSVSLTLVVAGCSGDEAPVFGVPLDVSNLSARVMFCRAGAVYGLVQQPEAMSAPVRLETGASASFTFSVPAGNFATLAAECEAEGYPAVPYFARTWRVTDEVVEPLTCTAIYSEPGGLSEFDMTCDKQGSDRP